MGRRRTPDFRCTFESLAGETIFVDEFDGVVELSWRYRVFRFLGWTLPVVGAGLGMTVAAKLGVVGDN